MPIGDVPDLAVPGIQQDTAQRVRMDRNATAMNQRDQHVVLNQHVVHGDQDGTPHAHGCADQCCRSLCPSVSAPRPTPARSCLAAPASARINGCRPRRTAASVVKFPIDGCPSPTLSATIIRAITEQKRSRCRERRHLSRSVAARTDQGPTYSNKYGPKQSMRQWWGPSMSGRAGEN